MEEEIFITDEEEENTQANKYLLFKLENEVYGVRIADVLEIIEMQKITEVPDLPDYIRGVINLRGKVIPAMDLRKRFGLKERPFDNRTCIIIVNIDNSSIGLIVDTVAEVQDIPQNNIEPPPNFKSDSNRQQYIAGLGKINDDVKIIIDSKKIVQDKDFEKIKDKIEV